MKLIVFLMLSLPLMLSAAERPNAPDPQNRPQGKQQGRPEAGNRAYWRVFAGMSPEDRKAMRELRERSPEEYEKVMNGKVQALEKMHRERDAKIRALVDTCRNSDDPAQVTAAKNELRDFIRQEFLNRLADNERYIKELKRRAERLEQYLEQKRQNADQEIEDAVQKLLNGEPPPAGHQQHRRGRGDRPDNPERPGNPKRSGNPERPGSAVQK